MPKFNRFFGRLMVERLYHNRTVDDPELRCRFEAIQVMPIVILPWSGGMAAVGLILVGVRGLRWTW